MGPDLVNARSALSPHPRLTICVGRSLFDRQIL
jgi:hypothetical protein